MTHSFPTRRSSDRRSGQLAVAGIPGRQVRYMDEARWDGADIEPLLLDPVARVGELVEHVGDGRSLGGRRQGRGKEGHGARRAYASRVTDHRAVVPRLCSATVHGPCAVAPGRPPDRTTVVAGKRV